MKQTVRIRRARGRSCDPPRVAIERERKYTVRTLPPQLDLGDPIPTERAYLVAEREAEVRVRGQPGIREITVKGPGTEKRVEVTVPDLSEDESQQS